MTPIEHGLAAVLTYLLQEFPGASIRNVSTTTEHGITISVQTPDIGRPMITMFTLEFLNIRPGDIYASLRSWELAASLREFGPGHHVSVGASGLILV